MDEAAIETENNRLLTSDFVAASVANFANSFGMQMLVATLPVYVISLGGSQTDAGLVSGALAFVALLFRPFMGWLTDAWRRRPLVLIGTSCYGFASIVYLLGSSIPALLFGRFVHGFGLSCYTTASNAYVADIAPYRRRAEAVGLFAAAQALGLILGPVIGFMIIEAIGFHNLFYFSGGLAFTAFFISIFARERRNAGSIKRQSWSLRTGIVSVEALPMAWMALCMGMSFGAVSAFIAIFARSRGFQNPGFYFMVQAVALLISRIVAGRLADRYSRNLAIIPGFILATIALGLLPFARSLAYFIVSASLFGFGFGAAQPATMALLIDRVKPEHRGLATGTYYTGFDSGVATGSILLGMVSQHLGFAVMWPIAAACTILGLAGFLIGRRPSSSATN
ncbi:MAG: MFS transporter [Acidobacteria bacterium]|nr:MFS transporter [Acidobacteriota bacterium]